MTEPLASEVWPVVLPSQKVHLPRIIFFLQIDVEKELRGRAAVAAEQTDRLEIRNCGEMRKQTNSSQRDFNRHNEFNFVWCMQAVLKSWMSTFQTFVIPCKVYIFQSKHSRAILEIIQGHPVRLGCDGGLRYGWSHDEEMCQTYSECLFSCGKPVLQRKW